METNAARLLACLLCFGLALSTPAHATDVDGTNDCARSLVDWGDAPEDALAYPGVMGHFPTCFAPGAPGNQTATCPVFSPPPLATGYVRHQSNAAPRYWLGCGPPTGLILGIDSEANGKTNSTGAAFSNCAVGMTVDCIETAYGMSFGQDECFGSDDAGVAASLSFLPCAPSSFTFQTYSCATQVRQVYLNILVDWNHDGDWNDALQGCPACVEEWSVRNRLIDLPPGCFTQTTPTFMSGPTTGPAWMRITISDEPVNDDFPWAGTANRPTGELLNGETEDYPVSVGGPPGPCKTYQDFGDAPEGVMAYASGQVGHFPTCIAPTAPGTPQQDCPDPSQPPPGLTGYVKHIAADTDPVGYWLGCGADFNPLLGVDTDPDGRSWIILAAGQQAACDAIATPDCVESAFGMQFGQDECYGDVDAGLVASQSFFACRGNRLVANTYSCATDRVNAYLNVLVDWNGDGDWTDILRCDDVHECAPEWAVRNQRVTIPPGCSSIQSKIFLGGPTAGPAWMRVTISDQPAPPDYPWNGTLGLPGETFLRGETEDYPVQVVPQNVGVGDLGSAGVEFAPPAPNPARGTCAFTFSLPQAADVSLVAYDVAGREQARIVQEHRAAGTHTVRWDFRNAEGRELKAGLYFIRLRVGNTTVVRTVMNVE